ncbi:DedA family protein [Salinifilum aidingensis]
MAFISDFLALVAGLPRPLLVLVTGGLVLAECTLGLGFLVPGESGLLISAATVDSWGFFLTLALVVTLCAAVGDNIGYWLGRRYGIRVRETKAVRKLGQQHWDRATRLLRRFGIGAVLVARFLPVVRTLVPAAAGTSQLGYGRFLLASVVGAAGWSGMHVGVGWAAGTSVKAIEHALGQASWLFATVLVVGGVSIWYWRHRRARKQEAALQQETGGPVAADEDVEQAA